MKEKKLSPAMYAVSIMAILLAIALLIHQAISYLIVNRYRDNVFALGNVKLLLTEDAFPQDSNSRIIAPKGIVPKNPKLMNTGTTNEYVFLKVTVPFCNVQIVREDTKKIDDSGKIYREIFDLLSNDPDAVTVTVPNQFTVQDIGHFSHHPKWILLKTEENTIDHTHSYLFGYTSLLFSVAGENETPTLFDCLQMRNILEGELPTDVTQSVSVVAYGIQSEELLDHVRVADTQNVTLAELKAIFALYDNQEVT